MMSRKIVAVFDSRNAAQSARERLLELGVSNERISIADQSSSERTTQTSQMRGGFWSHLKAMFMPEGDRHTIEESMRRGGYVLVATVDDDRADEAESRLEEAGAVDLRARETEWRAAGWNPPPSTPAAEDGDREVTVPVVEESLRVGKREVNRGSVRVRSYMIEEPVHEEVRLREERVDVQRRPVQTSERSTVAGSQGDAFQERTVEVSETAEEAVVGKEAHVKEEVVVSKTASDRVERIDDTVRRTEVEVQDDRDGGQPNSRPKVRGPRTPDQPGRA